MENTPIRRSNATLAKELSSIPLLATSIFLIIGIVPLPSSTAISFNITNFNFDHSSIDLEGDAKVARNGILNLTYDGFGSSGRATYFEPIQLFDDQGNLASFTTHFTFIVDSHNYDHHADGFVFFMAPNNSHFPSYIGGSNLGLVSMEEQMSNTTTDSNFVAIEFDTFTNNWDPDYVHIGIDINFLKSVVVARWGNGIQLGNISEAWISYDSSTSKLQVCWTNFTNHGTIENATLSYIVSLSQSLSTRYVIFGFAASTGGYRELHRILSWDFSSTITHADLTSPKNLPNANARPPSLPPSEPVIEIDPVEKNKTMVLLPFWLSVGGAVLVACLFIPWLFRYIKLRRARNKDKHDEEFASFMVQDLVKMGPRKFSYDELVLATNNFNKEGKLGEGGFGGVYKGFLKDLNAYVAVKRVSKGSKQGLKEYASEVKIISQLRHRNLVQLLGWCHEKGELLLAYEFMPNRSLDWHLFKGISLLSWDRRYQIAQGLASALLYLHELGDRCVLHRDIKSSNVMLDLDFNAKLGDFGLARSVDHSKGIWTTMLAGTLGYMAPECITSGKASKQSDVYSFGIVALELACGRRPFNLKAEENEIQMLEWVWELHGQGKILDAADSKLQGNFSKEKMECLLIVGLWCAHPDSTLRPTIRQAINVLNFEAPMPTLPSTMPVLRYIAPSLDIPGLAHISSFPTSISTFEQANCLSNSSKSTTSANNTTSPQTASPHEVQFSNTQ